MLTTLLATSIMTSGRIPPVMPATVEASGYCCVSFKYEMDGSTSDANAYFCTNPSLAYPAVESLRQWRWQILSPIDEAFNEPPEGNQFTRITWRIVDDTGNVIYDGNEYLPASQSKDGAGKFDYTCDGTPIPPAPSLIPQP